MQSKATTVAAYLKELPADRRAALSTLRDLIRANVDSDVEEEMSYGHIGYVIPHRVFPRGYHCDPTLPVPYISLASQKQHMAVYLMHVGSGEEEAFLRDGYAKAGMKIDLGKCCLRFKSLEQVQLDVLAASIRRVPAREHLARYVAVVGEGAWKRSPASGRSGTDKSASTKRATTKRATTKRATTKRPATKRPAARK